MVKIYIFLTNASKYVKFLSHQPLILFLLIADVFPDHRFVTIVEVPFMCVAAHEGNFGKIPPETSNDGCLPGRAGGFPDFVN